MFVLKSRHEVTLALLNQLNQQYLKLLREWNAMVDRVNARGGERFLEASSPSFTAREIETLIKLCHPDKHGGSKDANEITARLLEIRKVNPKSSGVCPP